MNSPAPVRWALSTAAGKDATLALHRARAAGLDVPFALCLFDRESDRVRFHGTPVALVEAHATALGMQLLALPTSPDDFEAVFLGALARLSELGAGGVVFGNVHLADVRAWYEERTTAAGLQHLEPLWGEPPADLVREVVGLGYRARVASVDVDQGDGAWLGRDLDPRLIGEIEARGADPCGERGEYHTFVWDGPMFAAAVPIRTEGVVEREGHRMLHLSPGGYRAPGPTGRDGAARTS